MSALPCPTFPQRGSGGSAFGISVEWPDHSAAASEAGVFVSSGALVDLQLPVSQEVLATPALLTDPKVGARLEYLGVRLMFIVGLFAFFEILAHRRVFSDAVMVGLFVIGLGWWLTVQRLRADAMQGAA